MTFEKFQKLVEQMQCEWSSRVGQTAFNLLNFYRPDLSERIRGGALDPFHSDARLIKFWLWVREHWDDDKKGERMIKLEIEGEVPELERTVKFAFRRHHNAAGRQEFAQQAFLTAESAQLNVKVYPVKIDGLTKTVEVRRSDFEALGFTLVVK